MEEDVKLELTEKEYFTLEAYSGKIEEFKLKQMIASLQRDLVRKDLIILKFQIADKERASNALTDEIQRLSVKQENLAIEKQKRVDEISESLGLETNTWGYNSETLEIIL